MNQSISSLAIVLGLGMAAVTTTAEAGQQRYYRGNPVYYTAPPIAYSNAPGIGVTVGIPGVFHGSYYQGSPMYYANPPAIYYSSPTGYGSGYYSPYSTPYPNYPGPGIAIGIGGGRRYWR